MLTYCTQGLQQAEQSNENRLTLSNISPSLCLFANNVLDMQEVVLTAKSLAIHNLTTK